VCVFDGCGGAELFATSTTGGKCKRCSMINPWVLCIGSENTITAFSRTSPMTASPELTKHALHNTAVCFFFADVFVQLEAPVLVPFGDHEATGEAWHAKRRAAARKLYWSTKPRHYRRVFGERQPG
jgi:hypothetical protein